MPAERSPRVSVVMPVINPHPEFFPNAVRSVLGQTFQDLELVIVEDPSRVDGKAQIARMEDPRIRHLQNPSRTSLVDQRNRGLLEARADVVAFLDADDVALPGRIQKQWDTLCAHPEIDVLGSQVFIIDDLGQPVAFRAYPLAHDEIVAAMSRYNAIAQPSVMLRRRVILEAAGYQYRAFPVAEDYELWSRLVARGVRFANHPEPLTLYRVHSAGTKGLLLRHMLRATLDVKERFWRNRMDARARLRFYGERALLLLPVGFVLKLFMRMQYTPVHQRSMSRGSF